MTNTIKISLAILFFLCLLDMPYGFYMFVRFSALIGFGVLAMQSFREGKQTELVIYFALAILFQPIFKIALGRQLWNIVDVIVGVGLLVSIIAKAKKKI